MALLSIHVLGPFQASLEGEPLSGFASDKVRALLVYLALSPGRPHRREALAGLLWPEFPERSARTNLRNALANLRQVIGDGAASPPFLISTRQTIQFNGQSDYWLDAVTFEDLLAVASPTSERLEQAVSLARGLLLEGFTVADAAPFEEWLLLRREYFGRQAVEALDSLAAIYEGRGACPQALAHARRRVELEPWQEGGQRQLMRLLARSGRRAQALAHYEAYQCLLVQELGVEPAQETTRLYGQIQNDELKPPAVTPLQGGDQDLPLRLPGFLRLEADAFEPPLFVGRERELEHLNSHLGESLAGHGRVVFVTGGPGRGKTALLAEFGRQAMNANPDLLVASGQCNAYSCIGDPYLPFRDVMAMLTGDVEAKWDAGAITGEHAQRLWAAFPLVVQAVLDHGPDLLGVLVPDEAMLSRAAVAAAAGATWLPRLRDQVRRQAVDQKEVEQSYLFQQATNALHRVAREQPLLLVLDDLQWADVASVSLLFHLGRRLAGTDSRVLIACAYRPEEVARSHTSASSGQAGRHSLARALSEFRRTFGDVWVELGRIDRTEGRKFVDALLDAEPNRLTEEFHATLFHRTEGHALFTVELLRAMQERGDLGQDANGYWIEGQALDWQALPARVEAVIAERIDRLDPELQEMLTVASVEGEVFTAQVVTRVQKMAVRPGLQRLSQELERRHRLVSEQDEVQVGQERLSRYRFGHVVFRDYLYGRLGQGERRLLHGEVAAALEDLYDGQLSEMAVQLAHHYQRASDDACAYRYLVMAAERAARLYAQDEAIAHYTRAIEIAERASVTAASLAALHRGRGLAREMLGEFDGARADHEAILRIAGTGSERRVEWRALLDLGKLWAGRDYHRARSYFQRALELARRMDDPAALADSLNWMGNWHANAEESLMAIAYHQEALEIVEALGNERDLANTLDLLAVAYLLGGNLTASVRVYDRAIALCRELDDRPRLVTGLIARAVTMAELAMLASVPSTAPPDALCDFQEALGMAREIDSPADEAWAYWALGLLHTVQGQLWPCHGGLAARSAYRIHDRTSRA